MALKDTIKQMKELLTDLHHNLEKAAEKGNKAASQRVRTGSIKLEKLAKSYRKESVKEEKKSKGKKTTAKKAKKSVKNAAKNVKKTVKKAAKKVKKAAKKAAKKAKKSTKRRK